MLLDAGATLSEGPFEASGDQPLDQTFIQTRRDSATRELYAGFVLAELGEYVPQSDFKKTPALWWTWSLPTTSNLE